MGKPSSSHSLTKNFNHSSNSSMSKQKMNASVSTLKSKKMRKRKHKRTKKKIQKLFENLRKDSETSLEIAQDDSVLSLDATKNDTVIEQLHTPTRKRKNMLPIENEAKKYRNSNDNSLIIINDDELVTNNVLCAVTSPLRNRSNINCSTPVNNKDNGTIHDLIVNNFPQNNNLSSIKNFNEDVINLTKEINRDSYLTIDLTTESELSKNKLTPNTVIDVDNCNIESPDCTIVSISNGSLSMSGDSEVTVLENNKQSSKKEIKKFTNGISKLNSSQKGKLLEYIAKKIFSGCNVPLKLRDSLSDIRQAVSPSAETVEDTFIKEVILGEAPSRNSVGSNIYRPSRDPANKIGLRMIVIDGSNVAMEHTKGQSFSVMGLKICIDYFVKRGHVVKAFVPRFRCKFGKSSDPQLLSNLERRGLVVFTPSREIQGKNVVSYDDRYIVQCAVEFDGIIVSGDNYRDLVTENPRWRFAIENRVLPFTWVYNMIMFPKDPMGRNGPTLEQFLKH